MQNPDAVRVASSFCIRHSSFCIRFMPTYEYKCAACGHQFEKFQSITADPIKKCPECGKNKVQRLISTGAGLIFKGSGFYITDYRDAGYKEKAKAESGGGEASSNGKADAMPAETKAGGGDGGGTKAGTPATSAGSESKPAAAPAKSESAGNSSKASSKSAGGKGEKK